VNLSLVDQRTRSQPLPVTLETLGRLVAPLGDPVWTVDLVLVDDLQMTDLYERWYGGQGVTDVLSFSYLEDAGAGAPALAAGEGGAAADLWLAPGDGVAPVVAGEVVIAPEFVAARCGREGWDLATEWALLVVHGTLHVLGWRHDTPADRARMRACEARLLAAEGFHHPLPADGTEAT